MEPNGWKVCRRAVTVQASISTTNRAYAYCEHKAAAAAAAGFRGSLCPLAISLCLAGGLASVSTGRLAQLSRASSLPPFAATLNDGQTLQPGILPAACSAAVSLAAWLWCCGSRHRARQVLRQRRSGRQRSTQRLPGATAGAREKAAAAHRWPVYSRLRGPVERRRGCGVRPAVGGDAELEGLDRRVPSPPRLLPLVTPSVFV
jgi:hypothetical protein